MLIKLEIILVVLLIIAGFLIIMEKDKAKICFDENCFKVNLALTERERKRGLMFKEDLAPDEGLLFVYNKSSIYSFWMKNVSFPLDIIWISQNKEVVEIKRNVLPCQDDSCPKINPGKKAKYVLEIKGGLSEEMGIFVGDKASFSF